MHGGPGNTGPLLALWRLWRATACRAYVAGPGRAGGVNVFLALQDNFARLGAQLWLTDPREIEITASRLSPQKLSARVTFGARKMVAGPSTDLCDK